MLSGGNDMAKNNNDDEFHLNLEMDPGFKAPSEETSRFPEDIEVQLHEAMQRALEEQRKQADP